MVSAALFLTLALQVQTPAPAPVSAPVAPKAAAAADEDIVARSTELSLLLNSEALVRAVLNRTLHETLPESLKRNEAFQKLEARWPGITGEYLTLVEPLVVGPALKRMAVFQQQAAAIYREQLTLAEINEMLAFYKSEAGTRLLNTIKGKADLAPLLNEQRSTGGKTEITQKDIGNVINNMSSQTIGATSFDDRLALMRFSATSAGQKLHNVNIAVQQLSLRLANDVDPDAEAQMAAGLKALIQRHTANEPPLAKGKERTSQ